MAWKKSPPALIETFDAVLPGAPAERRLMFGYPAAFVNGNMFMSLFEEELVLRLDEAARQALLAAGGTPFEPMKGRPMKEYVAAPAKLVGDRAALKKWADKALAYGRSLPPKTPKKAAKKETAAKKSATKASATKASATKAKAEAKAKTKTASKR